MKEKQQEKALEALWKTKADAVKMLRDAEEDVQCWRVCIDDVNYQIANIHRERTAKKGTMHTKVMIMLVITAILALVSIFTCGCQTAKGVMGDTAWLLQSGADNIQTERK